MMYQSTGSTRSSLDLVPTEEFIKIQNILFSFNFLFIFIVLELYTCVCNSTSFSILLLHSQCTDTCDDVHESPAASVPDEFVQIHVPPSLHEVDHHC